MEKSKEELLEQYQNLMKSLNESIRLELKFSRQPVSSSDSFYKMTDRFTKQNKQQKILDEIIDVVEKYNNLPCGSIKLVCHQM